jgi:hypothetical protein
MWVQKALPVDLKMEFQCSKCSFRTTLKNGTDMQNSRMPFRTRFLVMLFMTTTKKGIYACELQRQKGHKRYMTIYLNCIDYEKL